MPTTPIDFLDQFDGYDPDFMDQSHDVFEGLIGRYLIYFSYLEYSLDKLLAEIIDDRADTLGYTITSKMKMYDKIDLLERIVNMEKFHGLKRPRRIAPIIAKLKEANTFRNNLAHANWSSMRPDGMTRVKVKIDRENGVWFQSINLSASTLTNKLVELDSLLEKVDEIELGEF